MIAVDLHGMDEDKIPCAEHIILIPQPQTYASVHHIKQLGKAVQMLAEIEAADLIIVLEYIALDHVICLNSHKNPSPRGHHFLSHIIHEMSCIVNMDVVTYYVGKLRRSAVLYTFKSVTLFKGESI